MIELENKIKDRTAKIAVVGLGYVGLPLAVEAAKAGFVTTGIDTSAEKVGLLNNGKNYIGDIDDDDIETLVEKQKLNASRDFSVLAEQDCISICVPTPLGKGKNPDMSFIIAAVSEVKKYLRRGQAIILESTTYPGTTREVVLPLLEESGLKAGEDFYLAFSPERIDPGNKQYQLKNTPKIIGGITKKCTELCCAYYQSFIDSVIPVSSANSAEMTKLLENTFRAINIGLANEVAIMCRYLGVDTWEVINAAASKPFGFMPFYPGPGLGGHCIPVDPQYLVWKLKGLNYNARFIQLADEINSSMPKLVVDITANALNQRKKPLMESRILILGVSYKKDIDDCRESPALDVIELLKQKGSLVDYFDPTVQSISIDDTEMSSIGSLGEIGTYDCVVLITDHTAYDIPDIVSKCQLFVDTRNVTRNIQDDSGKIVKL